MAHEVNLGWDRNGATPLFDQGYKGGDRPANAVSSVAVNFDQVDLSWPASSTSMTLVERADAEVGPYVIQAWDEVGVSSRRLNNHMPSTTYYYRIRRVSVGGVVTETLSLGSVTTPAATNSYYVSGAGSDANDGLSLGNAFLTCNKFHSIAQPGDICYIKAGTYYENTATSVDVATREWTGTIDCAQSTQTAGTEANPIVMRPFPGDETLVIMDGRANTTTFDGSGIITAVNDGVAGIYALHDYWHFYGFEMTNFLGMCIGIKNPGTAPEASGINIADLTNNVVVENHYMHSITDQTGNNTAFVAPWGGYRWSIRNLRLDNSAQATGTRGNAMQWYGALEMVIENVKATDAENCIQMKDHYVLTVGPRTTGLEATVRGCDFNGRDNAVSVTMRGSTSNEAGEIILRYNLLTAANSAVYNFPVANTTANRQSDNITIEHNTLNGTTRDIVFVNTSGAGIYGNILANGGIENQQFNWVSSWESRLIQSNYNAFNSDSFVVFMDRFNSNPGGIATQFNTLADWQAATNAGYTLAFDNPDPNSVQATQANLLTDVATRDYSVNQTGPAYQALPDTTDMGCFRFGGEIIGLLPDFYWGAI